LDKILYQEGQNVDSKEVEHQEVLLGILTLDPGIA
jgi:hypothetical protein